VIAASVPPVAVSWLMPRHDCPLTLTFDMNRREVWLISDGKLIREDRNGCDVSDDRSIGH
jgi:hypothetical protein